MLGSIGLGAGSPFSDTDAANARVSQGIGANRQGVGISGIDHNPTPTEDQLSTV
jgi:hypothetical protein